MATQTQTTTKTDKTERMLIAAIVVSSINAALQLISAIAAFAG